MKIQKLKRPIKIIYEDDISKFYINIASWIYVWRDCEYKLKFSKIKNFL